MRLGVKVSAEFSSEDGKLTVAFIQKKADRHPLYIVCCPTDSEEDYILELSEDDLHHLFYWLTMHMSNCNRISKGLGPMPIWDGALHTQTVGKTEAALRLADDRKEAEGHPARSEAVSVHRQRGAQNKRPAVSIGQLGLGDLFKIKVRGEE